MNIAKKMSILVGALTLAGAVSVAQADVGKVAVVNVQQLMQQSPRVASLSKNLEAQFKARQAKIASEQQALQNESEKLKKESPTMKQADRDALQKKLAADRADLVKQVVAYQQDVQKSQSQAMQSVMGDLNSVVSSIAKAQGYSIVLDSQAVLFSQGSDITADVAKQFNDKK